MTRPLPDWAKQATPIVNPDPSAASTRQTPPPVPGPSDGGNASERDSQLAGTASAGATLQAMRKILRDAGLIDPESNADERPNAGQDGTVPLDDHLTVVDLGIALIEALAAEKARADAAEAKLREVSAERGIIASGYRERVAERDAALSKLDAITDHAGSFHAAMLGPAACNPDSVRVRAVAALDGIRDVITDQGDFTAVTRERLADRAKLDEIREALDNRLAYPSPAYAFAEIRAIAERPAAAPAEPREDTVHDSLADAPIEDYSTWRKVKPKIVEVREDTVPCGRDDEDCSLRGGTAHCGGCRE